MSVSTVDLAIASLMAQSATEQNALDATKRSTTIRMLALPSDSKAIKAKRNDGSQAAPIHNKSNAPGVALPEKGTLDAAGFMTAIKSAGKRLNDQGVPYTDQSEVRNDTIKAISAYVGYDTRGSFGAQDVAARQLASRQLGKVIAKGPARAEQKSVERSLAGFVAGLPDTTTRTLADLQGREAASAEAMIQHEKNAEDPTRSELQRMQDKALAAVEAERIASIRIDIQRMGF